MQVSAGNLDGLVGFSFGAAQFVGVTVASYAQSPDLTVIDVLTAALASSAAPGGGAPWYTIAGIANGPNQIAINAFASATDTGSVLQVLVYNVIAYDPRWILVSSMTLAVLIAELQAGRSIAGQVGAIAASPLSRGASLRFSPSGTFAGTPACFALGTRILTERGEVAVEHLRAGTLVPGQVSRRLRRVAWIGRRGVDVARHPRPWDVAPVRIRAGALAPGRPRRDVLLSPDHAVLIEGALIPVRYLVNGATIAQEFPPAITYLHVELDEHDVVLADGLPCESYLDTGNRDTFSHAVAPSVTSRTWQKRITNLSAASLAFVPHAVEAAPE